MSDTTVDVLGVGKQFAVTSAPVLICTITAPATTGQVINAGQNEIWVSQSPSVTPSTGTPVLPCAFNPQPPPPTTLAATGNWYAVAAAGKPSVAVANSFNSGLDARYGTGGGSNNQTGAGPPTTATPAFIGQFYQDEVNGALFLGQSLTEGDWAGAGGRVVQEGSFPAVGAWTASQGGPAAIMQDGQGDSVSVLGGQLNVVLDSATALFIAAEISLYLPLALLASDTGDPTTLFYTTAGVPSSGLGANENWCLSQNGNLYFKTGGAWVVKAPGMFASTYDPATIAQQVLGTTATQTVSNKRNVNRVVAVTQSATPAIDTDNCDIAKITALAQAVTSFTTNLTGTPNDGDVLVLYITDSGTNRALTWGAKFTSTTISLPTTTSAGVTLRVFLMWSGPASVWECTGVA